MRKQKKNRKKTAGKTWGWRRIKNYKKGAKAKSWGKILSHIAKKSQLLN